MSSVSVALLAALMGGSPSLKVVPLPEDARRDHVVAELPAAEAAELPEGALTRRTGRRVLTFSIVDTDGQPGSPMLGDYSRKGSRLTFTPRFRLTAGSSYAARLHLSTREILATTYRVTPPAQQSRAEVTDVFPSAGALPANALKFYIHFSQTMREGRAIFDRIQLLDEHGKQVLDPWRRTELWTEDARRFTVWIHPGRVKQGVNLREDLGPVLHPGRKYTLLIEQTVQSQNGQPLKKAYRKIFRTVPEDRSPPLPQKWKLTPPPAGSRMPLRVDFGEPLDQALVQRCVRIHTADGRRVDCLMELLRQESAALLTPPAPWLQADYTLVVDPILEDLAGNTPVRIFDTDLTAPSGPEPELQIQFRPSAPVNVPRRATPVPSSN